MPYMYGGHTDAGYKRDINEDHIRVETLDDNTVLAMIADGAGSRASTLQSAQIATDLVSKSIRRIYNSQPEMITGSATLCLCEAIRSANGVIGAFKTANEELYVGFAASMTCVLLHQDSAGNHQMSFAHIGNTRLYLIRVGEDGVPGIRQLTRDQTQARTRLDNGEITEEEYHTHPERLVITGALGFVTDPPIQAFTCQLKKNDILLLSTDGIHYAIRPQPMLDLILASPTLEEACETLSKAAVMQQYNDNGSSVLIRCV